MQPLLKTHDRHSIPHPHFLPKFPRVELEITRGQARERVRQVPGRTFFIGSSPDCDLVLADDHFPELHSYLLLTPESAVIRHLGGGPGLSVDGQPQTRAILTDQSRIEIGPYEFTIHIASPSATLATRTQAARGGAGHPSPVSADMPARLARQPGQVLQNVATFLDSWSSDGGPNAWSRGQLSGKPLADALSGLPLPVSVGLVAPCVKPPPWRHMAATA